MSKDLILNRKNIPDTVNSPSAAILQQGQKNMFIQHADKININVTPGPIPTILPYQPVNPSEKYYNLIVSNEINLDTTEASFSIEPKRALTEHIDDEIKKQFSALSEDAIRELQTFPTIFAHENSDYGFAAPDQQAGIGYITKIKVRHAGIIIKSSIKFKFYQQLLNENLINFDIDGHERFSELNRTHWTVKKVNLFEELRELGFQIS